MALSIGDRRLGAILLDQGYLGDNDLQRALERHSEVGGRLADVLIDSGMVGEKRIARAIEEALGIPLVNLLAVQPDPAALRSIRPQTALNLQAFPFALEGDRLRVALVDPLSSFSIETLEDDSGFDIEPYQALREEVMWAIATHYPELGLEIVVPSGASDAGRTGGKLGERLITHGYITDAQLQVALDAQQQTGEALGATLISQRAITEDQLYEVLAEQEGTTFLPNPSGFHPGEEVLGSMLRADALRLLAVPVDETEQGVTVLTSDPRKRPDIDALIGRPVQLMLTRPRDIERLIEQFYPQRGRLGEQLVQEGTLSRDQLREALQVQAREGKVKPLGEVITELGFASPDEVDSALQKQNVGGGRLEDTLVQSGKLSPEMLARSLAAQLGYEFLDPIQNPPDPKVALMIPEATARRYVVVPVRLQGNSLVVAMKDPRNVFALDDLKLITGKEILPAVMAEKDIIRLIERYFGEKGFEKLNKELAERNKTQQSQEADLSVADESAIVQVVDSIIREAALQDASDIHIETTEDAVKVRYRIDGALREQNSFPKGAAQQIMARLKIMGHLDIAERRVPQDGRVRFKKGSIDLDLRLSTLPTVYGEKAVMRLLQKASNIPELEQLGFSEYNYARYTEIIERPNGIFLVTGPTGSGKSFTCFSTLKRIAKPEKNTTTIEDPIEYEVPGIVQSQVNNSTGMTFARALRAFLRQDPDIIFVGEIRDQETAKIAVEAALTGHMVLATLHTNDAPGAVTRLEEMGIENFNISAAVMGVLAQRLVRRVCSECKQPTNADPEVLRRLGISERDIRGANLMRGTGCPRCGGTGYKGRMGIHELMVMDDSLRRTIGAGRPAAEIRDVALGESGLRSLRQDGIEKALQGLTTLEEVLAVTAS
ncbi:ATPase, T2SS/T4P/T4SS family [Deinococcus radiodurans]|mgnify:CR=1 FL=1|uniref:ATPase, T2SS/T4P/T4SS family n=1 Tax=Deinococcus radiodurans TaxID=1299 RepID=UPI0002E289A1|nr:ATPase, T2SS/T4P/T4SS family [Deinococcus radiodurans]ANC70959.1 ATP-binding protein [Deinococcus radiodurans R1 = ATCC 13939 = DSM 20539]QIP29902.1 Flp pilus assembly complex ATPase component TadA [Deinococcus radiodurans]QIP31421.1 Flp pilus assembly complex ATPase component TadA [Deinococcus radiodurans]UID70931.1 ATP-binding protein [Deinococcus radiodurans R1 = ATCC 13939 = DSM 20539]UTA51327.1 Flp pilus assembly complex ATPase component TadA [Deinococcus radiodurans]